MLLLCAAVRCVLTIFRKRINNSLICATQKAEYLAVMWHWNSEKMSIPTGNILCCYGIDCFEASFPCCSGNRQKIGAVQGIRVSRKVGIWSGSPISFSRWFLKLSGTPNKSLQDPFVQWLLIFFSRTDSHICMGSKLSSASAIFVRQMLPPKIKKSLFRFTSLNLFTKKGKWMVAAKTSGMLTA